MSVGIILPYDDTIMAEIMPDHVRLYLLSHHCLCLPVGIGIVIVYSLARLEMSWAKKAPKKQSKGAPKNEMVVQRHFSLFGTMFPLD